MATDSATWRSIRQDFESLPQADWHLSWRSHPPFTMFVPTRLASQWIWSPSVDASLRTRANAIFLKAAKARDYDSEEQWLDELRRADFVGFRISGGGFHTLPDGKCEYSISGHLGDAVKHSITLCHQLGLVTK